MSTGQTIRLRAVRGDENQVAVERFFVGLRASYRRHRVESVATVPRSSLGGSTLVVAEDETGTVVAGMRLLRRHAPDVLPFERIMIEQGCELVHPRGERDAELGLTWVAEGLRGTSVSAAMMSASLAVAPLLGITRGYGIGHQYATPLYGRHGFTAVEGEAPFRYPDDRYVSQALVQDDLVDLPALTPLARDRVHRLRAQFRRAGFVLHQVTGERMSSRRAARGLA